jgi:hypothetical protein
MIFTIISSSEKVPYNKIESIQPTHLGIGTEALDLVFYFAKGLCLSTRDA